MLTGEDRFVAVVRAKLATATANRDKSAAVAATMAKIGKGEHGAECAMTTCQNPNAMWRNHSDDRHYCGACALLLNCTHYREAQERFGGTLCVFVPHALPLRARVGGANGGRHG